MENGNEKKPTKEQVVAWVKRDAHAASYFLAMLVRYPDIVDKIADELYDRIMSEEQGALIDSVAAVRKEAEDAVK